MLLVKSKELKNSDNKKSANACKAGLVALFASSLTNPVHAQDTASSLGSEFGGASSFISIFLSLVLVIAIIFALAYLMRRFNVTQAGNGQMKVVASMMAGAKEKIMVIEVGDEQHLIGITSHNINHLATLKQNLDVSKSKSGLFESQSGKVGFQQKLVQAMAQTISGQGINGNKTGASAPATSKPGVARD
uniref:flagellar biosynthetic protein FliO n=1 Tax=Ningiella ruwaisensis TaxID=2364274 RepID=UPI0010A0B5CF|nr:flagellar biosynthetic protein FliO [Ningiella ruwaisensis]